MILTTRLNAVIKEPVPFFDSLAKAKIDLSLRTAWIAGGFLRRLLADEDVYGGDIDIFTRSAAISEKIALKLGEELLRTGHNRNFNFAGYRVQLVGKHFKNAATCISKFDFHFCQLASDGRRITFNTEAIGCVERKVITVNKISHATSSFARVKKYLRQGYDIEPVEILKVSDALFEQSQRYSFK